MIVLLILFLLSIIYFQNGLKLEFKNHVVAFLLVWLFSLSIEYFPISNIHKNLELNTKIVIFLFIFSYFLGHQVVLLFYKEKTDSKSKILSAQYSNLRYNTIAFIYVVLQFLNIMLAGYIPFVRMILTDDSGYADFGITGFYGVTNSFATAFGVLSFYSYLATKRKKFLFFTLLVPAFFILFVTRQNVLTLVVEIFVLINILRKIEAYKIFTYIILVLLGFVIIGDMRTSMIKEAAEIKEEFYYLPSLFVWCYSYFYAALINLNNAIALASTPYYDFSSFAHLIPNFIRISLGLEFSHDYFLERAHFNVSSAISDLYLDCGLLEVCLVPFVAGIFATYFYKKTIYCGTFYYMASYAVMYFCAVFSFFANMWFYLPIIFQIPFMYLISKYILKENARKNDVPTALCGNNVYEKSKLICP